MTVWEEADGLAALAETFGYTHEEIAKKISKSRTTVTESMAIAGIPEDIREKCRAASINAKSTLLEIARQFDDAAMSAFVENITSKSLSREAVRNAARPHTKNVEAADKNTKSSPDNVFRYVSAENGFQLEVKFRDKGEFGKKDVLQALKEAFDKLRAQN